MWPTLPIEAAGTSTSLFPNLGNSVNCISRQRRKTFPPIIFSNKRPFPTHRSFADWRQILFQQLDHQKTFSHLQETWQVTVAAKLRSATSWGSLQSSDQKYTFYIMCMLHIRFQDSSSCSLQSFDHLEKWSLIKMLIAAMVTSFILQILLKFFTLLR